MAEGSRDERGESMIWVVLLGIILLFTVVILYARHVNISRQEAQSKVPVVAHYTNYAYGVTLRYPPEWQPVTGTTYERYEGADGFFAVSAGGGTGLTLEEMVNNELDHPLRPYGATPTVTKLQIDGQESRLIMPSADQDPSMHGQAVIIARYPKPVTIGSETYIYFIFWADRSHIQDVASSIKFLNR